MLSRLAIPLRTCSLALFILAGLSPLTPARAQWALPGELPSLDAELRAAIVDSVTAVIDTVYVLEDPARPIVEGLRRNLADGLYEGLDDPAVFAEKLSEDAQAIHHDGHFGIRAMQPLDPAVVEAEQDEDPLEVERRRRMDKAQNYGFSRAEILPGGVGYLRFDRFADGDEAFAAAAAAMNFLSNSNAIILDLRANGGGSASMIRLLAGYLFPEETHLINWDIRDLGLTKQSYSADYVPGRRSTEQPVYVLVSGNTFSAAEEFTFDLKNLERATVVGETTGGGGHTVSMQVFDFGAFRVGIRVPYGRAYDPLTGEGWEVVGVTPQIECPADQALDRAHAEALSKLMDEETDEGILASYRWARVGLEARLNPITLTEKKLKDYVADYGPRRVFLKDGALHYQREGRPAMELRPMGEDLFAVEGLDYFRLEFERGERGKVVRIIGLYDNGRTDSNERS